MNWTILTLESNTADGGVTTAHWRVDAEETVGAEEDAVTYRASAYGTCGFNPDVSAEDFIAYADWVWASVDKEATEASLTAKIEADKAPVSTTGVPW